MYTTTDIANLLHPHLLSQHRTAECPVTDLSIDSRRIVRPGQTLFVALPGERHDGHDFVADAYRQGGRAFIVQELPAEATDDAHWLVVDDSWASLQLLARRHREQFSLPVIGITGSNGKTIVKEWLFQLLHRQRRVVRSPRSYNSQVGVPLSVWQMHEGHELGIFEAGISQPGEMDQLAAMIQPTLGIFTTLGAAHDEGFTDRQQKVREKMRLFRKVEQLLIPLDEPLVAAAATALGVPLIGWSRHDPQADLYLEQEERRGTSTRLYAHFRGKACTLDVPFTDRASLHNAITCWCALLALDIPEEVIQQRMQELTAVPLRLEVREGIHQCRIINDGYNADLTGLESALEFLAQQAGNRRRTLILADLLQSGQPPEVLYQQVANLCRQHGVQRIFTVGRESRHLQRFLPEGYHHQHYPTTEALLSVMNELVFHREVILLKGSRPFGLERVGERLARQVHQTRLEVNLSAMAHNLRQYQRLLAPGTRMMVMVKAAAYGSGSRAIARFLQRQRIDYLGVAYADEGIELREAGIDLPILVLNPEEAVFDQLRRYQLEPEVYSFAQLEALSHYVRAMGATMPVHLNIDTGMHRLGFTPDEADRLGRFLAQANHLPVVSVFTHLAASDLPREDAFTHGQLQQFFRTADALEGHLSYRPWRHALNTHGISRFPQYQMDMVRLGIGVYGIDQSDRLPVPLRTVLSLRGTISQVKQLPAGATIGYNRSGKATRPMRLATVTVGYADGLPRAAGNGRCALRVHSQKAPIVGDVCMDMCMIDVTHIPEAREGDPVTIFGEGAPVEAWAQQLQTIPYELFTGISTRVKRVYIHE